MMRRPSAPVSSAAIDSSKADSVQFPPVPAITGTRPDTRSTVNLVSSIFSLGDRVDASPVVPQTTRASIPSAICHSISLPMDT